MASFINSESDEVIDDLKHKHQMIDSDWLMFHFCLSIILVIFACLSEFGLGLFLINSDMVTTSTSNYFIKFFYLPSLFNIFMLLAQTYLIKANIKQKTKIYAISLILVLICFVLYTVHSAFVSIFIIFAIAISLTTIYADYKLTILTGCLSIIGMVISELFIIWDKDKISIFANTSRFSDFVVSILILIAFLIVTIIVIYFERKKNEAIIMIKYEHTKLEKQLMKDELTGLANRKAMVEAFKIMENDHDHIYYFVVGDLNGFKKINDIHGHHVGDKVLVNFSEILRSQIKKMSPFRYGGDEFCLLFKDVEETDVIEVCEQINDLIKSDAFIRDSNLQVSVSFGIVSFALNLDALKLFIRVDQALYQAKANGKVYQVYQADNEDLC